jgi:hypothetical protein
MDKTKYIKKQKWKQFVNNKESQILNKCSYNITNMRAFKDVNKYLQLTSLDDPEGKIIFYIDILNNQTHEKKIILFKYIDISINNTAEWLDLYLAYNNKKYKTLYVFDYLTQEDLNFFQKAVEIYINSLMRI